MEDILFIGGPKDVQGVDRIDDDLVSILSADGLFNRKAVVVWPTDKFMEHPEQSDALLPLLEDYLISIGRSLLRSADTYEAVVDRMTEQTVCRMWRLLLQVSEGLKVILVVNPWAKQQCYFWANLVVTISPAESDASRNYTSTSPCGIVLDTIQNWPITMTTLHWRNKIYGEDIILDEDEQIRMHGRVLQQPDNWHLGIGKLLKAEYEVSSPVKDLFGKSLAVQFLTHRGYMLFIPPPTQIKDFIGGIRKSLYPSDPQAEQDTSAKDHPDYTSWKKSKREFMDFFIPLATSDLKSESQKNWRDLVDAAIEELKVLNLHTHDLQTYRRYIKKEFLAWYERKIDWEKGHGRGPDKLF